MLSSEVEFIYRNNLVNSEYNGNYFMLEVNDIFICINLNLNPLTRRLSKLKGMKVNTMDKVFGILVFF